MKIKTSEVKDAALDWAVCMALGMKPEDIYISKLGRRVSLYRRLRDDEGNLDGTYMTGPDLLFSRKWEAGGPIIERERIWLAECSGAWSAKPALNFDKIERPEVWANTPLIAGLRCFVASKLGDEVDVPDELVNT